MKEINLYHGLQRGALDTGFSIAGSGVDESAAWLPLWVGVAGEVDTGDRWRGDGGGEGYGIKTGVNGARQCTRSVFKTGVTEEATAPLPLFPRQRDARCARKFVLSSSLISVAVIFRDTSAAQRTSPALYSVKLQPSEIE